MPRERVPVHHRAAEQHIDHVALAVGRDRTLRDLQHIARPLHHAFRDEKAGGQLRIVTRRTHHHGYRTAFDADFEWIFAGSDVFE